MSSLLLKNPQLIWILRKELTQDRLFHLQNTGDHKLVVTGEDPGIHQEEADIIKSVSVSEKPISSVCFFVLLLHHYQLARLDVPQTSGIPKH